MTPERLVSNSKKMVDSLVAGLVRDLPLHIDSAELEECAHWWRTASEQERQIVAKLLGHVGRATLYGLFRIIDNDIILEKDSFELIHRSGDSRVRIDGQPGNRLFDLANEDGSLG